MIYFERRSEVQAYLAAFDAYLQAGGEDGPSLLTGLKDIMFAELLEA